MRAVDEINGHFGRGTIFPAAVGVERAWQQRFELRSPRYTRHVAELPVVRA